MKKMAFTLISLAFCFSHRHSLPQLPLKTSCNIGYNVNRLTLHFTFPNISIIEHNVLLNNDLYN